MTRPTFAARPWLALVALTASSAEGAIVYVNFASDPNSAIPFTIDGLYLNVVTGQTGSLGPAVPGWDINPYFAGSTGPNPSLMFFAGQLSTDPARAVVLESGAGGTNLPNGYLIGPSSPFAINVVSGQPFQAAGGFLGFRFTNESTGQVNYGWALFSSTGASPLTPGSIRLLSYAYENSGSPMPVGFIPEPSVPLLLAAIALGAVGLRTWRKRKAVAGPA